MTKKPAHEVVLQRLRVHIGQLQTSAKDLLSELVHISAIQLLCEILQEMVIPEEHRLHVANQLIDMSLKSSAEDPESDLVKLLCETLPKIEKYS